MLFLVVRRLSQSLETGGVSFVIPVTEIEARHREPGVDERLQLRHRPARRSQGAHNLGLTRQHIGGTQNRVDGNIGTAQFRTAQIVVVVVAASGRWCCCCCGW